MSYVLTCSQKRATLLVLCATLNGCALRGVQKNLVVAVENWDFITHENIVNSLKKADTPFASCPRGGLAVVLLMPEYGVPWLEKDAATRGYVVRLSDGRTLGRSPAASVVTFEGGVSYVDLINLPEYSDDTSIGKVLRYWQFKNRLSWYPYARIAEVRTAKREYLSKSGESVGWEVAIEFIRDARRDGGDIDRSYYQVLGDGEVKSGHEF